MFFVILDCGCFDTALKVPHKDPVCEELNSRKMSKSITFQHQWTITEFSSLCNDNILGYPRFETRIDLTKYGHDCLLVYLYPKGGDPQNADYISIELWRKDLELRSLTWKCAISVLNQSGVKLYTNGSR